MLPSKMIFDDFFDDLAPVRNHKSMMCDIYEENGCYHIEMDAPGFTKDDIAIEYDKGNLKITAEKKNHEKTDRKYMHRERRSYEKCERSFYLGNVLDNEIKAEFKDGILKIVVPKEKENSGAKKINID